jgi:hypothetical protein
VLGLEFAKKNCKKGNDSISCENCRKSGSPKQFLAGNLFFFKIVFSIIYLYESINFYSAGLLTIALSLLHPFLKTQIDALKPKAIV